MGRLDGHVAPERTWVVAGTDLRGAIEGLGLPIPPDRYLWDPVGRNTAAAIGAAAEMILPAAPEGELLVLPSDHWIPDPSAFWESVETGRALTSLGWPMVTFGVPAAYPETGYGYIERGEAIGETARTYAVARFHEKPDGERAKEYCASGRCYWNSGIFLFRAKEVAAALRRHVPEMRGPLDRLRADLQGDGSVSDAWKRFFTDAPSISIDQGVLERDDRVAVTEARFAWSDLGNWTSWGDRREPDPQGNRVEGMVLARDTEGCVLFSEEGGLLAVAGIRDLVVVRIHDATLVLPKEKAQEVRQLVRQGQADEILRRYF